MKRIAALFVGLMLSLCAFAGSDADPFAPMAAGTITISATQTNAQTALKAPGRSQVMIYNAGTKTVFVEFGTGSTVAAVATGTPIPVGAVLVLSIDPAATHIATICNTGETATVYVTVGKGT